MANDAPIPFVIADDLSGAAEVAGAALRYGWNPRLLRLAQAPPTPAIDRAVVIDTDSRATPRDVAAQRVRAAFSSIAAHGGQPFKKIDSLLRGPVLAEIEAALDALGRETVLLHSHNPSRGRCVVDGRYLVDGVPLNETPFRGDPEYPRHSADVRELLGKSDRPVLVLRPGDSIRRGAINVACASTLDEVHTWARSITPDVLPVGGVDLFPAILARHASSRSLVTAANPGVPRLILSGSASAYARALPALASSHSISAFTVPPVVFGGDWRADASWHAPVINAVRERGACVLTVGRAPTEGSAISVRLQQVLAACATDVYTHTGAHLFVDGGATAAAVIDRLGWHDLDVRNEIAPGVVELHDARVGGSITIKPGSYAWPAQVWS